MNRCAVISNFGFKSQSNRLVLLFLLITAMVCTFPANVKAMTDREIETAIDSQLLHDNAIPARMIDVRSQDGIVTLSGAVNSLLAAQRAVQTAETVKGVRTVINDIDLVSMQRSDNEILKDVQQALKLDPVADIDEIEIAVADATVTLTGKVDSWQEKKLTGVAVKGVKGVRAVDNRMDVNISQPRPDDELAIEIRRRLAWDVWVEASRIGVKVSDGYVTLTGTVGSLAEKNTAVEDAWIVGARAVDGTGLIVDWEAHRRQLRSSPRKVYADNDIKQAILSAFAYDPRITDADIDVWVENGTVTLKGSVAALSAGKAAEQDARNTAGVWRVKNLIKVRPEVGPDYRPRPDIDAKVARHVRLALLLDPDLHQDDITVTVKNHLVMLEGRVDSEYARKQAGRVAAKAWGAAEVVNNLEVVPGRERATRDDWQIKQDVESELHWSPYVDADAVSVAVNYGVAVLTGTVEDLRARRAATLNARQGGAVEVQNHLKVRNGPDFLRP
jgi:osmotically-inducible protein OsmY